MECIFCEEVAKEKFRNKAICRECISKIKLIFKTKETEQELNNIPKNPTENVEINKETKPQFIDLKRVDYTLLYQTYGV